MVWEEVDDILWKKKAGTKGRGDSEHYVSAIIHLNLAGVLGTCWGIMENSVWIKAPLYNFKATDCCRTFILVRRYVIN